MLTEQFYVVSEHVSNSRVMLKLESIPFSEEHRAESWGEFIKRERKEKRSNAKVYVVKVLKEIK